MNSRDNTPSPPTRRPPPAYMSLRAHTRIQELKQITLPPAQSEVLSLTENIAVVPDVPAQTINAADAKILKQLCFQIKEFADTRKTFSGLAKAFCASIKSDMETLINTPVTLSIMKRFEYELLQVAYKRAQRLAHLELEDPFPNIDKFLNTNPFTFTELQAVVHYIHEQVVNAKQNAVFKERSQHCLWFTLYFPILLNSPFKVFIFPVQNLARMGLFSKDIEQSFQKLFSSETLTLEQRESLQTIYAKFMTLKFKAQTIGEVANTMLPALAEVQKKLLSVPQYTLSDKTFIDMGFAIFEFIEKITVDILEAQQVDEVTFKQQCLERVATEFSHSLAKKIQFTISAADEFFYEVNQIFDHEKSEKPQQIKALQDELHKIHECQELDVEDKLQAMSDAVASVTIYVQTSQFFPSPWQKVRDRFENFKDALNKKRNELG